MVPTGVTVTDWFPHPLDANSGTTFDGRVFSCYKKGTRTGELDEWVECPWVCIEKYKGKPNTTRTADYVRLPAATAQLLGKKTSTLNSGRFALECYIGRSLHSYEVARHGANGPADHSYTNLLVGDSVNNMIDDLENGKSITSLSYLVEAQARLTRLISSYRLNPTKPTV